MGAAFSGRFHVMVIPCRDMQRHIRDFTIVPNGSFITLPKYYTVLLGNFVNVIGA